MLQKTGFIILSTGHYTSGWLVQRQAQVVSRKNSALSSEMFDSIRAREEVEAACQISNH